MADQLNTGPLSAHRSSLMVHRFFCAVAVLVLSLWIRCTPLLAQGETVYGIIASQNVMVPMRDGVRLATDIYRPGVNGVPAPGKFPVILIRTPYDNATAGYIKSGKWWASHGYAFVVQDVRGRGDSDGQFYPLTHEASDGDETGGKDELAGANARPESRQRRDADLHDLLPPRGAVFQRDQVDPDARGKGLRIEGDQVDRRVGRQRLGVQSQEVDRRVRRQAHEVPNSSTG